VSNALKFSTSVQTEALNVGNYWIGTGDVAKGPTDITSYWSSILPPAGGYTVYLGGETGGYPAAFCPANDDELISLTNRIAGTNYSTAAECLSYYATQPNRAAVNKNYPPIVTNGLSLLLDASYDPSYPTTGSTWYDLSGNDYNGTIYNGPAYNSNGYLDFDGTDDWVLIGGLALSTSAYTKVAWFYPDGASANIISGGSDGQHAFWMAGSSTTLYAGHNGAWQTVGYSPGNMVGRWWFGAVSFNTSTGWNLYLNDQLVDTDSNTTTFTGGTTVRISAYNNASNLFNGKIATAQVYNRVLSGSEILQNYYQAAIVTSGLVLSVDAGNLVSYQDGTITTYSLSSSATGSLVNGVSFENMNGGTWTFDGTDDRISISSDSNLDFLGTLPYSIEVWGNLESLGIGARMMVSRENSIGVGRDGYNILLTNMNSSTVSFSAERFASNVQLGISTSLATSSVLNKWSHYVATYDGQFYRLFFNGSLVATSSSITSSITNTTSTVSIANRGTGLGNFINMKMAVVSIYNTALSAAQVAQNFNARRSRFGI